MKYEWIDSHRNARKNYCKKKKDNERLLFLNSKFTLLKFYV